MALVAGEDVGVAGEGVAGQGMIRESVQVVLLVGEGPDSLQVAGASDVLHCWPGHEAGRLALTLVVEVR